MELRLLSLKECSMKKNICETVYCYISEFFTKLY